MSERNPLKNAMKHGAPYGAPGEAEAILGRLQRLHNLVGTMEQVLQDAKDERTVVMSKVFGLPMPEEMQRLHNPEKLSPGQFNVGDTVLTREQVLLHREDWAVAFPDVMVMRDGEWVRRIIHRNPHIPLAMDTTYVIPSNKTP